MNKLEKTGTNVAKTSEAKKAFIASKDRFDKTNKLLLLELPQFYEKRVDYFQPCLQALIRAQVINQSIIIFLKTDVDFRLCFMLVC
jgi:BAR domain